MDPTSLIGLILILAVSVFVMVCFYYLYEDPLVPGGTYLVYTNNTIASQEKQILDGDEIIPDPGYRMQSPGPSLSLLRAKPFCGIPVFTGMEQNTPMAPAIVCNHEPYFSQSRKLKDNRILYLNAFTGKIYQNPGLYSPNGPPLDPDYIINLAKLNFNNRPNIAYFGTYRGSSYTSKFPDLRERQDIALFGHEKNWVKIYGNGWPFKVEHNSRSEEQQIRYRKQLAILRNHFAFSLCSENTIAPNYITEKIWAAIEGATLPIYKGGNGIEKYFPSNSFIDTRDYKTPLALYEFVAAMIPLEYERRLRVCVTIFNQNRNKYEAEAEATKSRLEEAANEFCKEQKK